MGAAWEWHCMCEVDLKVVNISFIIKLPLEVVLTVSVCTRQVQEICLFSKVLIPALGPTCVEYWLPYLYGKSVGHGADRSHPSNAVFENIWSYTSIPLYCFLVWYLIKFRNNFSF
jgi:hypothetical protein